MPIPKMNIYTVHPFSKVSGPLRRKRTECKHQRWYMTTGRHTAGEQHTQTHSSWDRMSRICEPQGRLNPNMEKRAGHTVLAQGMEQWQILCAGRGEAVFCKFLQAILLTVFSYFHLLSFCSKILLSFSHFTAFKRLREWGGRECRGVACAEDSVLHSFRLS